MATNIYLRSMEVKPSNIRLRDPTVAPAAIPPIPFPSDPLLWRRYPAGGDAFVDSPRVPVQVLGTFVDDGMAQALRQPLRVRSEFQNVEFLRLLPTSFQWVESQIGNAAALKSTRDDSFDTRAPISLPQTLITQLADSIEPLLMRRRVLLDAVCEFGFIPATIIIIPPPVFVFNVSIPVLSTLIIGGSQRAEASEIMWMIDDAMRRMVASGLTTVAFNDRRGFPAGTLSWTPVNTS